jgi:hypothetical protein
MLLFSTVVLLSEGSTAANILLLVVVVTIVMRLVEWEGSVRGPGGLLINGTTTQSARFTRGVASTIQTS